MAGRDFSRKEKMLGLITFLAALAALIYASAFDPFLEKWSRLDRQIKSKRNAFAKDAELLSEAAAIRGAYKRWAESVPVSPGGETDVTAILSTIEEIAKKNSVRLVSVKPVAGRGDSSSRPYATEILLDVSAEADAQSLSKFMYEVERPEKLLRIRRLTVAPGSTERGGLRCTFLIGKIVV